MHCSELWVEQGIQHVKSNVKYRSTGCPEELFAHLYMVEEVCLLLRHADASQGNPGLALKPFDEWLPEYRQTSAQAPVC